MRDGLGFVVRRLGVVVLTVGMAAGAAAGEESWRPRPPMPDDADWVQLTSGEWLRGEIVAMYQESLEFDSDKLDDLTLDWEDVREIRTAQVVQVRLEDRRVATGRLLVEDGTVRVLGPAGFEAPASAVLSITPGEPKEINYWSGGASVGVNLRSGNTEQTETNGSVRILRRTPKTRLALDYLGNFSRTDGTTTSDNQQAAATWDLFLSNRVYLRVLDAEYYRDPFQNISRRWTLGAGAGYQLVDTPKIGWRVDAGLAYQQTRFHTVPDDAPPTAETPAVRLGTRYDHELSGWLDLYVDYRLFLVDRESGTYTHRFHTGLEIELLGDLDLTLGWVWDRIQDPQPASDGTVPEKDDFRTIFSVGYSF